MSHESHEDIVRRLKVARGHLEKVIHMISDGEPCLSVAQQLKAVESSIEKCKTRYIRDHIEHCLDAVSQARHDRPARLSEFKKITEYL